MQGLWVGALAKCGCCLQGLSQQQGKKGSLLLLGEDFPIVAGMCCFGSELTSGSSSDQCHSLL